MLPSSAGGANSDLAGSHILLDSASTVQGRQHHLASGQRLARGEEPIDFGLSLHVGEVLFGNIGVPERLEFSVVGPAASEAARIEDLTKQVACGVLASEIFVRNLPLAWQSAGHHHLRGVEQPVEVFALPGS